MTVSIRQALGTARDRLANSPSARLDAEVLLAFVLGKSRSFLFAYPEHCLSVEQHGLFAGLTSRRAEGEPIAYLIGTRGFWTLELVVTPSVLIPRPETERLVELALALASPQAATAGSGFHLADLGTGSGAIALALASERPHWTVYATDASEQALAVAHTNAERLGIKNICCVSGSWCDALPIERKFDMIVSNPPYIAHCDPHLLQGDLRFEPSSALVAEESGLGDLALICQQAPARLKAGGYLLLEHGYQQGLQVRSLLESQGFENVRTEHDLAGHERVSLGSLPADQRIFGDIPHA